VKWKKLGQVFKQTASSSWINDSALTPTPFLISPDVIRVYAGFRDNLGVSRIGFVDVAADNPANILNVSNEPCLDIGEDGCFDDNGVILGDVVKFGNEIRMYYVGFQLVKKVKFLAYTGLAISTDNGISFQRVSKTPVLDRTDSGVTINAIHSIIFENGLWRTWYAAGSDWQEIKGQQYPKYNIWYTESENGIDFDLKSSNTLCIDNQQDEYRIGRPSVFKVKDKYFMFYTKGSTSGHDYFPGVATSPDGIHWTREDSELGLFLSQSGFDSEHLCYPRIIDTGRKVYCFYNGNNMGKEGFGVAELIQW